MYDYSLPTPELLGKILKYDPESGFLFWRERPLETFGGQGRHRIAICKSWNKRFANKRAFTSKNGRYLCGLIMRRSFLAHRVAWAMSKGRWPDNYIDHINGDTHDNRIENLRDVTHAVNNKNKRLRSPKPSGCYGVYWVERNKKWRVRIGVGGIDKQVGYFKNKTDAIAARKAAEVEYGYYDYSKDVK